MRFRAHRQLKPREGEPIEGELVLAFLLGLHFILALIASLAAVLVRFGLKSGLPIIAEHEVLLAAVAVGRAAVFAASRTQPARHLLPRSPVQKALLLTAAGTVVFGLVAVIFPLIGLSGGRAFPRSLIMLEAFIYFALSWLTLGPVSRWRRPARWRWRSLATVAFGLALLATIPNGRPNNTFPERWPPYPEPTQLGTSVTAGLAEWQETEPAFARYLGPYIANGDYLRYGETRSFRPSERLRLDARGVPMLRYGPEFHYNPVTVAQHALSAHGRYLDGRDEPAHFLAAADTLVNMQDHRGALPYEFEWRYYLSGEVFKPGWPSAMAQGQALSVFGRAWELTGDARYLESGRKALDFLMTPISEGGVMGDLRYLDGSLTRYIFFEEYVSEPYAYTLNGYIFTLLGLYDWSKLTSTTDESVARAEDAFSRGIETLRGLLPYYDIGGFSSYDLGHLTYGKDPHVAARYHAIHIYQLHALHSITGEPIFKRYERRWISYTAFDIAAAAFSPGSPGFGNDPGAGRDAAQDHSMAVALYASAHLRQYTVTGYQPYWDRAEAAIQRLVELAQPGMTGALGWGLGFSWDAFGDGSKNPAHTVYGITTALAIQALLDHHAVAGTRDHLPLVDEVLAGYEKHFTPVEDDGYFWYSEMREDARAVLNVSAMLAGQYARAGRILGRTDYLEMAESAARYIIKRGLRNGSAVEWPYEVGRNVPNDSVHAAYTVQGLAEVARHGELVGFHRDSALTHLRHFMTSNGRVTEVVGRVDPARSWGVGYLMFVLCEYGSLKADDWSTWMSALQPYEFEPGHYGMLPGRDDFYPRFQAHVLMGLAECADETIG